MFDAGGARPAADLYLHGQCHVLALALHRLTGRPILAAIAFDHDIECDALVHCWVSIGGDQVLDASGVTKTAWSLQSYPDGDEAEVVVLEAASLTELGEGGASDLDDLERRLVAADIFARELLRDEEVAAALAQSPASRSIEAAGASGAADPAAPHRKGAPNTQCAPRG